MPNFFILISLSLLITSCSLTRTKIANPVEEKQEEKNVWLADMDKAIHTARKENKDILISFTGSDWCPPCIKLHKEVFDKEKFKNYSKKHFILVELDFPRTEEGIEEQTEEQKNHNEKWKEKFNMEGFPTVILMSSSKKPYSRIVGYEGNADFYFEKLSELQKNQLTFHQLVSDTNRSKGLERARKLDKLLSIDNSYVEDPDKTKHEIYSLSKNQGDETLENKYKLIINEMNLKESIYSMRSEHWEITTQEKGKDKAKARLKTLLKKLEKLDQYEYPIDYWFGLLKALIAECYIDLGDTDKGLSFLEKTVLNKKYNINFRQQFMLKLATLYSKHKSLESAINMFEASIAIDPNSKLSLQNIAIREDYHAMYKEFSEAELPLKRQR